jgi:hypothetical protein
MPVFSARGIFQTIVPAAACVALAMVVSGCASISEDSHAYLGSPRLARTAPASVVILTNEPARPKDRLGEVRLSIEGEPSRDDIEAKLKDGGARLGADAVLVVYDRVHVYPVVYAGWYGPTGVWEAQKRQIVGVALRYR